MSPAMLLLIYVGAACFAAGIAVGFGLGYRTRKRHEAQAQALDYAISRAGHYRPRP